MTTSSDVAFGLPNLAPPQLPSLSPAPFMHMARGGTVAEMGGGGPHSHNPDFIAHMNNLANGCLDQSLDSGLRVRRPNFTPFENALIVEHYEKRRDIFRNRGTDAESVQRRLQAWAEIANEMPKNHQRSADEIKKRWKNLVSWARREHYNANLKNTPWLIQPIVHTIIELSRPVDETNAEWAETPSTSNTKTEDDSDRQSPTDDNDIQFPFAVPKRAITIKEEIMVDVDDSGVQGAITMNDTSQASDINQSGQSDPPNSLVQSPPIEVPTTPIKTPSSSTTAAAMKKRKYLKRYMKRPQPPPNRQNITQPGSNYPLLSTLFSPTAMANRQVPYPPQVNHSQMQSRTLQNIDDQDLKRLQAEVLHMKKVKLQLEIEQLSKKCRCHCN